MEVCFALAHEGLLCIGRDVECMHFFVNADAPILVIAAKNHDACFYVLVNLADKPTREAFSRANGFSDD